MDKSRLFTKQFLFLIVLGTALNLVCAQAALYFELPLFLDSIGTIAAAALGGGFPGVIVGLLSNYINSASDSITLYYGFVSVILAICAERLSLRGVFRRLGPTLLSCLLFAVVGGGLGSLLTWMLSGLGLGTGVSRPFAVLLHESLHIGVFFAQLVADMCIDVADKLITVIAVFLLLRITPGSFAAGLQLGYIYDRSRPEALQERRRRRVSFGRRRTYRTFSLGEKLGALFVVTAICLCGLAVLISYRIYVKSANERYEQSAQDVVKAMEGILDGDEVERYIEEGVTPEYLEKEALLYQIKNVVSTVTYMYVYDIREDGCHVVFDLDSGDVEGAEPGTVIPFDEAFEELLPTLLAGGDIEPLVSHGSYGWLMTVYKALKNDAGETVAYMAVDISMETVMADRFEFMIRMVSLLFGVSVILLYFSIWFARNRLVAPLNALAAATSSMAYTSEDERQKNADLLKSLNITTGDEIENLYRAVEKTEADLSEYLLLIDKQNSEITEKARMLVKLQDNIIISFADMVENRDENTGNHIMHTAGYVRIIGHALREQGLHKELLTDEYLANLEKSAPLHDIGKIKIPDAILNKPGRLTEEEFAVIKTHPDAGRQILQDALSGIQGDSYISVALELSYCHHEKWDGSGYPLGLSGEDIPLAARIMALADVFDALISERCYKSPMPFDEAVETIRQGSGTHFDPEVVGAFLSALTQVRELDARC